MKTNTMNNDLHTIFSKLHRHETFMRKAVNLIPSENAISTLVKLPLLTDFYIRYCFDEHEMFGKWFFKVAPSSRRSSERLSCHF